MASKSKKAPETAKNLRKMRALSTREIERKAVACLLKWRMARAALYDAMMRGRPLLELKNAEMGAEKALYQISGLLVPREKKAAAKQPRKQWRGITGIIRLPAADEDASRSGVSR
jgi:hypothetical protein